ncbi:MAG: hypothetical protein K2P68_04390 [Sphingomonas sp.]|nr:hypothetical protein [Sphingomonas sp.]
MIILRPVAVMRTALALTSFVAIGTFAAVPANVPNGGIELDNNYQKIPVANLSGLLAIKFANLAALDPDHPLAGDNANQTLSMFGREDLIASISGDYAATHCSALTPATDILTEVERRARETSIVIVNESHERSEGRGFTTRLAVRLRPLGYNVLALEALQNNSPATSKRYQASFITHPNLPYLEDNDGFYLSEAGFGRLGRTAKELGYRLLAYEANHDDGLPANATTAQRIAVREEEQARNIAAFINKNPGAKLLVHVGYHHVLEVPLAEGAKWMAARLKEKTGIDPLTISQTDCRGDDLSDRLAVLPADQPAGSVDLVVDHPIARFDRGRPVWRATAGDRLISVPRALRPSTGWRVIEARPVNEPVASVPMDRVAIRPDEDVGLLLPPGKYQLRVIDVKWGSNKVAKSAH